MHVHLNEYKFEKSH